MNSVGADFRSLASPVVQSFRAMGNPALYVKSLGKTPYSWQETVLDPRYKRICLLAARQSGKSMIVAGKATHKAKMKRGALCIIIAPTERQAKETALKVKEFIRADPELKMDRDNDMEILLTNGSRIVNVVANDNNPRGYSNTDLIIMDEASRIPDVAYTAVRPQMVTNPNVELVILSTPFGKEGFFWRAWSSVPGEPEDDDDEQPIEWTKVRVEIPYTLGRGANGLKIIDKAYTEEELRQEWEAQGVHAFFSPHHTKRFMREELREMGAWMWRQEYGIEFMDSRENLFDMEDVMRAKRPGSTALFVNEDRPKRGSSQALVV